MFCFVQVSRLVVSEIISRQNLQDRVSCIEKWAAIADICRCMHNYNGVLQICAAFVNSSVYRLKKTWEKISKQVCLISWAFLWFYSCVATELQSLEVSFSQNHVLLSFPLVTFCGRLPDEKYLNLSTMIISKPQIIWSCLCQYLTLLELAHKYIMSSKALHAAQQGLCLYWINGLLVFSI